MNNDDVNEYTKLDGEKSMRPQPTQGATDNRGNLGTEDVASSRKEHANWLSSANRSPLKPYIQRSLYGFNSLYLRIYIHTYIYMHEI